MNNRCSWLKSKLFKVTLLVAAMFTVGLSFGPRVPDDLQEQYCVKNHYWAGPIGVSLNCDSPLWMSNARNLSELLDEKSTRQARPVYPLMAAILMAPIRIAATSAKKISLFLVEDWKTYIFLERYLNKVDYFAAYLAFLLLHLLFLFLSVYLSLETLRITFPQMPLPVNSSWHEPAFLVLFFIFFNDVNKAFLLSPHTQVFNIFIPIFLLYAFVSIALNVISQKTLWYLCLFSGFGILIYGTFIIAVPVILMALIYKRTRTPYHSARGWIREFFREALSLTMVVLPGAAWVAIVWVKNGNFYHHAAENYGQFVWIMDSWRQGLGELLHQIFQKFYTLALLAIDQSIHLLVVLAFILATAIKYRVPMRSITQEISVLTNGAILVSSLFFLFFGLSGLAVYRVALSVTASFIVLVACWAYIVFIQLPEKKQTQNTWVLGSFIFIYGFYVVCKNGPYS